MCTYSPGFEEYNAQANQHDAALCVTEITWGCMAQGSCNYNTNATSDCSNVSGGTNISCCQAASTTAVECVRDFDNDGFQDEGIASKSLAAGKCGCTKEYGYGWKAESEMNGVAIWGCTKPYCPEYEPTANRDDGKCCLGFTAADSVMMFGDDFANKSCFF